jgi:hypothetical protein
MNTLSDWLSDEQRRRLYAEERLIVGVAEEIWSAMDRAQMSKTDIAAALGKSKAFITQVMSGTRNMTLRTLSDLAFSMGATVHVTLNDHSKIGEWQCIAGGTNARFRAPVILNGTLTVGNDEWQSFHPVNPANLEAA